VRTAFRGRPTISTSSRTPGEDLVTMKRTASREQDLIDLRSLGVTDAGTS
jgi:hypothetical protein